MRARGDGPSARTLVTELGRHQALNKHDVREIRGEQTHGSQVIQKGMEDASGRAEIENREGEEFKSTATFPCQVHQEVSQIARAEAEGTTHDGGIKKLCLAVQILDSYKWASVHSTEALGPV